MKQINYSHTYEYRDGIIMNESGGEMSSIDEYAEEMNMLMDSIVNLRISLKTFVHNSSVQMNQPSECEAAEQVLEEN